MTSPRSKLEMLMTTILIDRQEFRCFPKGVSYPSLICISQARSQRGPASPKPLPVAGVTAVKHPKGLPGPRRYRKTVKLDSRFEFDGEVCRSHFRAPHEP